MERSLNWRQQTRVILMVDDDDEDIFLTREAIKEIAPQVEFKSVNDGQELLDYLHGMIGNCEDAKNPWPEIILLDLNMPVKGGFETLDEIRNSPDLKAIPVVILSTSVEERDINKSFRMGANSFISKPKTFPELLAVMSLTMDYWFGVSCLPSNC